MTRDEVAAIMGDPDYRVGRTGRRGAWYYTASIPLRHDPVICVVFDPVVSDVEERPHQQISFDSADWKKSSNVRRGFMIDDLLRRFDLTAMARSEVIDLLGEPSKALSTHEDWDLVYCLGPPRGSSYFPIDSDWLVLGLDGANRVKEVDIVSD